MEFLPLGIPLLGQDISLPTFESDIVPILKANCLMCHGETTPQAGLDLRTRDSILKGGKSGRAVVPGSSDKSLLIDKIASKSMPPGKVKLTEDASLSTTERPAERLLSLPPKEQRMMW